MNRSAPPSVAQTNGYGTPSKYRPTKAAIPHSALTSDCINNCRLTRLPASQVEELLAGHPMAAKTRLAREVTARFHTGEAAEAAARAFERVFSRGGVPDSMPVHRRVPRETVAAALVRLGAAGSSSEARRLVKEGGVRLDGVRLEDPLAPLGPGVLRAGRRRYFRIEP